MIFLGYIDTTFPTIGTFISQDIVEMKKRGIFLCIFPLRPAPGEDVQDAYLDIMDNIIYTPFFLSKGPWKALLYFLFRRPYRFLSALLTIFFSHLKSPEYLLKSLAIIPKSCYIASLARKKGISHFHAN